MYDAKGRVPRLATNSQQSHNTQEFVRFAIAIECDRFGTVTEFELEEFCRKKWHRIKKKKLFSTIIIELWSQFRFRYFFPQNTSILQKYPNFYNSPYESQIKWNFLCIFTLLVLFFFW